MNIPDEAIEASAKALYQNTRVPWDSAPQRTKELCLRDARLALQAAAPYWLPKVWDEGHEEGWLNHESGLTESEGRKRNWYRGSE